MRRSSSVLLGLVVASTLPACTLSNPGTPPVTQQFHYPIAADISPDSNLLYVVNSDFDLQYNGGELNVVNVQAARNAFLRNGTPPQPLPSPEPCNGVGCPVPPIQGQGGDVSLILGQGVAVNPFATAMALAPRPASTDPAAQRLYITVRGDGTLTWVDVDGPALDCGAAPGALCDQAHRVGHPSDNPADLIMPPKPVAMDVAQVQVGTGPSGEALFGNYIVAVHEETPVSRMSLFVDGEQGSVPGPVLTNWIPNLSPELSAVFRANPDVTFDVASPMPDPKTRPHWYALSRDTPVIDHVRAFDMQGTPASLYLSGALAPTGLASDVGVRAMVRDPCNPTRGYATARPGAPAAGSSVRSAEQLLRFDLTDPEMPQVDQVLSLPAGPSHLVAINTARCTDPDVHTLVYTVSYDARKIYVTDSVDWRGVDEVNTQSGPNTLLADPFLAPGTTPPAGESQADHNFLYLVDFAAMCIEIIDVDPTRPTHNQVVFTIGRPVPPRVTL